MDFSIRFKSIASDVTSHLDTYLAQTTPLAKSFTTEMSQVWDKAYPLWLEGKRLRAALVIVAHELFEGNVAPEEVMKSAMSIELIHSYLLIHDDIMDKGSERRGVPTVHEIAKDMYKSEQDPIHIGNSVAICYGDVFCHLGLQILNESNIPTDTLKKLNALVNKRIIDVGFGQIFDFLIAFKETTNEDILKVYELKTGAYTYELPLSIGATLANATEEQLQQLSKYAIPAGIAFQIIDEIIGTFGDDSVTGKSTASDLVEGKKTLLVQHTMDYGSQTEKLALLNVLGKKDASAMELKTAKEAILSSGALDYARSEAKRLMDESTKALEQLENVNKNAKEFLIGLNEFVLNRDK